MGRAVAKAWECNFWLFSSLQKLLLTLYVYLLFDQKKNVMCILGGKVSIGLTATTIVSQWTWSATLLQSSTVASKVGGAFFFHERDLSWSCFVIGGSYVGRVIIFWVEFVSETEIIKIFIINNILYNLVCPYATMCVSKSGYFDYKSIESLILYRSYRFLLKYWILI